MAADCISPLTRAFVEQSADAMIALSDDLDWDDWTLENFLYELPEKWRLSRIAQDPAGAVVGYTICSLKGDAVHLHHIILRADRRGGGPDGLARRLMDELVESAVGIGAAAVTLKVHESNRRARRFYAAFGFSEDGVNAAGYVEMRYSCMNS